MNACNGNPHTAVSIPKTVVIIIKYGFKLIKLKLFGIFLFAVNFVGNCFQRVEREYVMRRVSELCEPVSSKCDLGDEIEKDRPLIAIVTVDEIVHFERECV